MKKLKTLIIEDEKGPLIVLKDKIGKYCPDLELCGEATTKEEAIVLIRKLNPDLIFLDIQLGEKTGFDLLEELPTISFKIVFITAYNEFALKAFRFNALDYLLKPVQTDQLMQAVDRAVNARVSNEQIKLAGLGYQTSKWDKIAVPSVSKITYVALDKLFHVESDGAYSILRLDKGEKILSTKPLKEYEKLLEGNQFYRVHRSHLINILKIKAYQKGETDTIVLENNSRIEVSRKKRTEILNRIANLG